MGQQWGNESRLKGDYRQKGESTRKKEKKQRGKEKKRRKKGQRRNNRGSEGRELLTSVENEFEPKEVLLLSRERTASLSEAEHAHCTETIIAFMMKLNTANPGPPGLFKTPPKSNGRR
jgi:hypothetical protein